MSRFVWVDNKELHDQVHGMTISIWGNPYSTYSDRDEGFIYDTEDKLVVMDFGNDERCYPNCGMAPSQEVLGVMLDALNNHQFNKESK